MPHSIQPCKERIATSAPERHAGVLVVRRNRLVPTYTKSQITPLRNNYNGATPDPSYIPEWRLTLEGSLPA